MYLQPSNLTQRPASYDVRRIPVSTPSELEEARKQIIELNLQNDILLRKSVVIASKLSDAEVKLQHQAEEISQLKEALLKSKAESLKKVRVAAEPKKVRNVVSPRKQPVSSLGNVNPETLMSVIVSYTGISREIMANGVRYPEYVLARHLACWFLSHYTRLPLWKVTEMVAGKKERKDHTFAVNGRESIRDRMQVDPSVRQNVEDIQKVINEI